MIFIIKQKTHEKLHASNTNPPRKSQPTDIRSSQIGGGGEENGRFGVAKFHRYSRTGVHEPRQTNVGAKSSKK